jgi:hypothetical protein
MSPRPYEQSRMEAEAEALTCLLVSCLPTNDGCPCSSVNSLKVPFL